MSDYESATSFLGEWGRFQRRVFVLLCLTAMPNGFAGFWIVFLGDTPPHRCLVPAHVNLTAAWRNSSIPLEAGESGARVPASCSRYKLEQLESFSRRGLLPGVHVNLSDVATEGCLDGWEYDHSVYISTISTEWDLVCDNKWKNPMTSSIFFGGVLTGSFVSGQLSDRYGRKILLFATLAIQSVFTVIQSLSPSWAVFCALHFIVGIAHISNYMCAFVLGTEVFGPRVRTIFSTMGMSISFDAGYMLLPLCAYLIRDWRMLILALTIPTFIPLTFWWFIPESPRWLLSQGRVKEAEAIVRDAARRNNIEPPPPGIFSPLQTDGQSEKRRAHNICELFRYRNIRGISVTLWLVWITVAIGYVALSLNTANLHGDAYFNCFLSAVVEVPAYILSWVLFRWCYRRPSQSTSLVLGGVLLLFIQLIPENLTPVAIALEMTGKFAVSAAFSIAYAYTAELYPTVLRNTAMGACSMAARIGAITAPYFIYLRNYSASLPYILMGSLTALLGLLSLLLPESFGMPLPDTIAHMQHFPGCCQKKRYTAAQTKEEEIPVGTKLQVVP